MATAAKRLPLPLVDKLWIRWGSAFSTAVMKTGIHEYIVNCYAALHTTGPEYIIEDISSLIEERSKGDRENCFSMFIYITAQ